jgi:hypothetical protein
MREEQADLLSRNAWRGACKLERYSSIYRPLFMGTLAISRSVLRLAVLGIHSFARSSSLGECWITSLPIQHNGCLFLGH